MKVEHEHRVIRLRHPLFRNLEYWITILTGDSFRSGFQSIRKGKRKILIDNPYPGNTGVDPLNHLMVTFEGDLEIGTEGQDREA